MLISEANEEYNHRLKIDFNIKTNNSMIWIHN